MQAFNPSAPRNFGYCDSKTRPGSGEINLGKLAMVPDDIPAAVQAQLDRNAIECCQERIRYWRKQAKRCPELAGERIAVYQARLVAIEARLGGVA